MEFNCLKYSAFDAEAFGFPYYRVQRVDAAGLAADLKCLPDHFAVDAKCAADDVASTHVLMNLGFRKVCMQISLHHDLSGSAQRDPAVHISGQLQLDEETIQKHARNFSKDRFSLDPLLDPAGRYRLYAQWWRNSLAGNKQVAHLGPNLCTFFRNGDQAVIDLVSILQPGQGIGKRIIQSVVAAARESQASGIRVTTECENTPAWNLYQRCGFVPVQYTAVFHMVRK